MKIAVSGGFLRPGQDGNICWLFSLLSGLGLSPLEMVRGRPLAWDLWVRARLEAMEVYREAFAPFDLVIGFELHLAARTGAKHWVNVRRHPFRWMNDRVLWSVETSFPWKGTPDLPRIPRWGRKRPALETCFTTQVSSDASLLQGYELLLPETNLPMIAQRLATFERVWICPHPFEQTGPWVHSLLTLPNAALWHGSTYTALFELQTMFTMTSSTGYEAPYFGCSPTFLAKPEIFSQPYEICSPDFWRGILQAFELDRSQRSGRSEGGVP